MDGGKVPRLKDNWKEIATTDETQIRQWWGQYPNANLGVPCEDFIVLDVDGDAGRQRLRELELEYGELPMTPLVVTGRGGAHYYFQPTPGLANGRFDAAGLDLKTPGGYVVGVGSETEGPYLWEVGFGLNELELAVIPQWLVDLVSKPAAVPAFTVPKLDTMTKDSGRNQVLYRLGRSLRAKALPSEAIRDSLAATNSRFATPLDKRELEAIINEVLTQADQSGFVPAVLNGNGGPPATIEIDRTPVDAFEAWQIIAADQRGYLWGGLLREGCTTVLSGPMGSGKTTLGMNFARSLALGEEFLGRACQQSKTLVVVSPKEYEAWADTIWFWQLRDQVFLLRSTQTHFEEGAGAQAQWFETTMKEGGFRAFVLDTLFDFFGMPPNARGDSNRIAMAEQTPILEVVNKNSWGGLVFGHTPKVEAQALVPRDPEESFAGHTAWTAQHRMRMVLRRKSAKSGMNAIMTGRGGHGDLGILEEHLLKYDPDTRLVTLGGKFSEYLGEAALAEVLDKLGQGGWFSRSELVTQTGKSKNWVHAGIKHGVKKGDIKWNGKGSRRSKYAQKDEPDEEAEQGELYK